MRYYRRKNRTTLKRRAYTPRTTSTNRWGSSRRRFYGKRRGYRRIVRARRAGFVKQPRYPFARGQFVICKWFQSSIGVTTSAGTVNSLAYLGNDIVAPGTLQADITTATPFATWQDFYKNFYVYRATFKVYVNNQSGNRLYVAMYKSSNTAITGITGPGFFDLARYPNCYIKYVGPNTQDSSNCMLSNQGTSKQMFSMTTADEDNYEGVLYPGSGTPPVDKWYFGLVFYNPAIGGATYDYRVRIKYYVALRNPRTAYTDD